jgi:hypothetical protein
MSTPIHAQKYQLHFSDRGLPLVYVDPAPPERGVVTVENYLKWYSLYVVQPGGNVVKLEDLPRAWEVSDILEHAATHSCFGDHVWHPGFVREWVQKLDLDLDERAFEMIAGRWATEFCDYPFLRYSAKASPDHP